MSFLIDPEISKKRMEICKQCPNYVKFTGQCKKCGCIMRIKTKLHGQECPENRWDK